MPPEIEEKFLSELTHEEQDFVQFLQDQFYWIKPQGILEIGSGWGIFTMSALLYTNAIITTIDKQPRQTLPDFDRRIREYGDGRVVFIPGESQKIVPRLSPEKFDFIYIDGSHLYQDVKQDINNCWALLTPRGVMMLDDVFHKHNYDMEDGDNIYGVGRALWEWAKEHGKKITIYPSVHGVAVIGEAI